MIDELLSRATAAKETSLNVGIAYFYMTYDNKSQSAFNMIKSLLTQLLYQSKILPEALVQLFQTRRGPGEDLVRKLFKETLRPFFKVFIVLDALDECDIRERNKLTHYLQGLLDSKENDVNICYTTRPELQDVLISNRSKSIVIGALNDDIRTFLQEQIQLNDSHHALNEVDRTKIITKIILKSQNMFTSLGCIPNSIDSDLLGYSATMFFKRKAHTRE